MKKLFQAFIFIISITISTSIMSSTKCPSAYEQRRSASLKLREELASKNKLDICKQPKKYSPSQLRLQKVDLEVQNVIAMIHSHGAEYTNFIVPSISKKGPTQIIRNRLTKKEKLAREMEIAALNNAKTVSRSCLPVKPTDTLIVLIPQISASEPQISPSFKQKILSTEKQNNDGRSINSVLKALDTRKFVSSRDSDSSTVKAFTSPTSTTSNFSPYKN